MLCARHFSGPGTQMAILGQVPWNQTLGGRCERRCTGMPLRISPVGQGRQQGAGQKLNSQGSLSRGLSLSQGKLWSGQGPAEISQIEVGG